MRKEYDFGKASKNPYVRKLKKQITIKIDVETIDYFKKQSMKLGIPYQTLINLYLVNCANKQKELNINF